MKTVSNEFKEQIAKLGREIDFKIFLHTNDKIITEDGKFLMTEDNLHLVVEQFEEEDIDEVITSEDIYNITISNKGNLLSTMMKEVDFETTKGLRVGDIIDCQFGLKVGEDYEYVDYGRYMIYSKELNEDTKTYSYVAYDSMLLTMQEIPDTSVFENIDLYTAMKNACETVGLTVPTKLNLQSRNIYSTNFDKVINDGTFTDLQMTYRDLLDMICQAIGMSMVVIKALGSMQIQIKPLKNHNIGGQPYIIVDTINENYLKDINVSFGKKYMINSVVLSRSEDNDNIYRRDEDSITEYGIHEFKIKDNPILLYDDREDYINNIFNELNGTEFYINDFNSTGITYLDWLDFYNVTVGNKIYKCLMLNDEIKIQQGLEETVYTEEPEETVTNYKTSSKTDKEVSFIVDKQRGQIKGTVQKDDIIASLNLAIEDGQGIVELKGNSVTIKSDNFELDEEGHVKMSSAEINHGNLKLYDDTNESGVWPEFSIESGDGSYYNDSINKVWSNLMSITSKQDDTYTVEIGLRRGYPNILLNTRTGNINISPGEINIKRVTNEGVPTAVTQITPGSITLIDDNGNRKTITPTN